jgi:hypothetical protein
MLVTEHASSSGRQLVIDFRRVQFSSDQEVTMMPRIVVTKVISAALLVVATSVSAQRTNQSDATGVFPPGVISRGFTQAFGAPAAPAPELISTPAMVDALCIERADAFLTTAILPFSNETSAERNTLALLRGGTSAAQVARPIYDALVGAGADAAQTSALLEATNGLLAAERPDVSDLAKAISRYNNLVRSASTNFLAAPPAELVALRTTLGRLSTTAITAYDPNRSYPGWSLGSVGYVTDTSWIMSGQAIQMVGATYLQVGSSEPLGERQLRRVGEHNGGWVLADVSAAGQPKQVFVAVRTECDVALVPFALQEKVIKR